MNELVINAGRSERHYWRDLWRFRELFVFLAWRDILVRYKQTMIGVAWAVLRPLLTMLILTLVRVVLVGTSATDVPTPVLIFAALLPWTFFATAMSESGNSLVSNANMISKVYFPRLIVPLSSVVTSLVDFLVSVVIFSLMMVYYKFLPSAEVFLLPLYVALAFASAFGVGVWVSAMMVRFRDFRLIVPFMVQFGLYASPVMFTSGDITAKVVEQGWSEKWMLLYYMNPMASVIDGFRWALLGRDHTVNLEGLAISIGVVVVVIVTGIRNFRKTERTFADVI